MGISFSVDWTRSTDPDPIYEALEAQIPAVLSGGIDIE